jgi:hypothetical protein
MRHSLMLLTFKRALGGVLPTNPYSAPPKSGASSIDFPERPIAVVEMKWLEMDNLAQNSRARAAFPSGSSGLCRKLFRSASQCLVPSVF